MNTFFSMLHQESISIYMVLWSGSEHSFLQSPDRLNMKCFSLNNIFQPEY